MSIPTEAIEAAARAIADAQNVPFAGRKQLLLARAALTAAAPLIEARAKAEALRDAAGDMERKAKALNEVSQNRAAHDFPTRVRYAAYAEESRASAHQLRARAATIEGETK